MADVHKYARPLDQSGENVIAVVFHSDDSSYPNLGRFSGNASDIYWHCMSVMCATARDIGLHSGRLIIFSNETPAAPVQQVLNRYEVQLIRIDFDHRPPYNFYDKFLGALHILDAIQWAASTLGPEDRILFVDPDCVFTSNVSPIFSQIERTGVVAYDQKFDYLYRCNGASRLDLIELGAACFGSGGSASVPRWLGGEFLGFKRSVLSEIAHKLQIAWQYNLNRYHTNQTKFNTEEQFLSAALHYLGIDWYDGSDGFVSRMWTTSSYRLYSNKECERIVWHLPSEKTRGFAAMYKDLLIGRFPPSAHQKDRIERYVGLRGDITKELVYVIREFAGRLANLIVNRTNSYR